MIESQKDQRRERERGNWQGKEGRRGGWIGTSMCIRPQVFNILDASTTGTNQPETSAAASEEPEN